MTTLEDELRQAFATQVAEVPAVHDAAGSAIARGRAVRRRQRLTTGAAFAVVVAVVIGGISVVRAGRFDGRPDRRGSNVAAGPVSPAPRGVPKVDLVVGGELRPAGRAPIALPGAGDVYDAVRVPEGWLVARGDKATHKLWLIRADGAPTLLASALPANFAFSGDGRRIAFQQGGTLTVAAITGDKLRAERIAQLPGQDGSQGRTGAELVGWAGRYVVIGNRLGLDYDGFDVWDPAGGSYVPAWNREVAGVYAATPDGRSVVGATKDQHPGTFCAAVLDPAGGLRAGGRRCAQPYLATSRHGLSPDGRRVLGQADQQIAMVDTTTGALIAQVAAAQGRWPAEPVWTDNDTFAIASTDSILYVDAADPTRTRRLPGPSTSEHWLVVARVGG